MPLFEQPLLLFLALIALYSPLAALPSYFGVVGQLNPAEQRRLALALFLNTAIFALVAVWVGEPLLEILGLTPAALTATGGIALMYEGVALMRGTAHHPAVEDVGAAAADDAGQAHISAGVSSAAGTGAAHAAAGVGEAMPVPRAPAPTETLTAPATTGDNTPKPAESWRRFAFVPVTFPLTVGGTTFAFFVAFRAGASTTVDVLMLSVAGLAYAAVTGLTLYASGHVQRRAKPSTAEFLDRLAGILLTAIAVTILVSGVTRLVLDFLPD